MNEQIENAIILLRENRYFVRKIPKHNCGIAEECCNRGFGDCQDCSCFVCLIGNDY